MNFLEIGFKIIGAIVGAGVGIAVATVIFAILSKRKERLGQWSAEWMRDYNNPVSAPAFILGILLCLSIFSFVRIGFDFAEMAYRAAPEVIANPFKSDLE